MKRTFMLAALTAAGLSGCVSHKGYVGPELPSSQLAKLVANDLASQLLEKNVTYIVEKVNGIPIGGERVDVLPGYCDIEISMSADLETMRARSKSNAVLKFVAVAGKTYQVGGNSSFKKGTWRAYVNDPALVDYVVESEDLPIVFEDKPKAKK